MPDKTNPQGSPQKSIGRYLEVYIDDDGNIIFNHVTKDIVPFLKKISGDKKITDSIYCG